MARPLRIEFEGAVYHLCARGNERQRLFRTEQDRVRFLELLARSATRYQVSVLAFVLMGLTPIPTPTTCSNPASIVMAGPITEVASLANNKDPWGNSRAGRACRRYGWPTRAETACAKDGRQSEKKQTQRGADVRGCLGAGGVVIKSCK